MLIAADFASMELRAAAEISGDAAMRNAFERGDDLHRLTAAMVTGKQPEEITPDERSCGEAGELRSGIRNGPERAGEKCVG